jgi:ElaB/YqjD/DUF883 family membrane-anchored ribosome-binding protein
MAIDATLTHELQALKEELAAGRGERPAAAAEQAEYAEQPEAEPPPTEETAEDRHMVEQLQDLIATFKDYIEEAEHNIAEHPAASVIGALFLGILIGRHIGKR